VQTLDVEAGRLAYWDSGTGPPLVSIHGVGTSGELFADDLAALASDCRLIVYDRRGYGASSESPRDWEAHRDDAAALIEKLDARPAVVAGYSGGSIVALDLALQRPDLVAGLVLVDPAFNLRRCLTPDLIVAFARVQILGRLRGERRDAEFWARYVTRYPTGGSAFEKAPEERRLKYLGNAGGLFADFASGAGEHVEERRLAEIAVAVTLMEAKLSPPFLRRSCERLRRLMPQAEVVALEHSGHAVALDARDELVQLLRDAAHGAHRGAAAGRAQPG
jgi:pimeloyl-ACP methyl ester carboxylesterase